MQVDRLNGSALPGQVGNDRQARSEREAAQQFEEVLVRQFVKTMTDDLFKSTLSGDDGPGWMESQADSQRDVLADVLTKHLVDSGALDVSDLLLHQWQGRTPEAERAPSGRPSLESNPSLPVHSIDD